MGIILWQLGACQDVDQTGICRFRVLYTKHDNFIKKKNCDNFFVFFVQIGMYRSGVLYTKHENFNNIYDVSFFFVCLMYLFCVYAQNIHKSSVIFLSVCASGLMVRVLF